MSVQAATSPTEIDSRTRGLLEAPLLRTLMKLAAPNAVVMVTQISIPLVEIYFIAKISIDALAGVSEVFPVLSLVGAISQGAVGGGVVSAIARTLGSGQRSEANNLVWYTVGIAVSLGLVTTAIVLSLGSVFYAAMGGRDLSLSSALTYSNLIFAGAVLIWLFNLLLAAIRGTGSLIVPLIVVCGGALLLLPLLPVLILGFGPIPGLGVTGGAIGILTYYAAGCLALITYLWGHRGVLAPRARPPMLRLRPIWEILRVGGMSALVSASTNITLATITGFVGAHGVAALAGYGAGSRLEFMLVSLSYGIGGPAGILIGTNIGAGNTDRALRVAWMGTLIAVLTAEAIGLAVAFWPMGLARRVQPRSIGHCRGLGISAHRRSLFRLLRHGLRALLRRARHRTDGLARNGSPCPRSYRRHRRRPGAACRDRPRRHLFRGRIGDDSVRLHQPAGSHFAGWVRGQRRTPRRDRCSRSMAASRRPKSPT